MDRAEYVFEKAAVSLVTVSKAIDNRVNATQALENTAGKVAKSVETARTQAQLDRLYNNLKAYKDKGNLKAKELEKNILKVSPQSRKSLYEQLARIEENVPIENEVLARKKALRTDAQRLLDYERALDD